ncbi:hypothetical protein [Bacillus sp. CDB3]|uniref:hypothetical protein n=1 Tax=Bacillus sp. CDB3 TaxID=360310 RepID=UPI0009D904F6|nr:hypothetical protein [Bacillus sp. CDB3]OQR55274.1 hypothetical protein CDB3_19360 [Bacillus sp. CDB3]
MKKQIGMIVSAFTCVSILLSGCGTTKTNETPKTETVQTTKDVRELVWNSLSQAEKDEIDGSWKDAKVSKVIADATEYQLDDASFKGKEVTLVTIPSKQRELLGDINRLVDEPSGKIVGSSMRK